MAKTGHKPTNVLKYISPNSHNLKFKLIQRGTFKDTGITIVLYLDNLPDKITAQMAQLLRILYY